MPVHIHNETYYGHKIQLTRNILAPNTYNSDVYDENGHIIHSYLSESSEGEALGKARLWIDSNV